MSYSPNTPVVSTDNAINQTVSGSGTITGTWELAPRGEVLAMLNSAVNATLFFEFSGDGVGAADSIFPVSGYSATAGTPLVRRAAVGGRYFRVRITYTGASSSLILAHVSFAQMGQLSAPIGNNIADDADATIVKAVISGVGNTNAVVTDHQALQVTAPPEGKTSFGEQLVGILSPRAQLSFPYNVNTLLVDSRPNQSGTLTIEDSMLKLSTGADDYSSATMLSRVRTKYEPGLGVRERFTARFSTPAAGSTQIIGIGDAGEAFGIGYNGTSFGIVRRYGGKPEIRVLTISAGANDGTGTDTVTVTLDGNAKVITLDDFSGSTTITANKIAREDYSDVGTGWTAVAVGATVVFTSWDAAAHSGTYSFVDTDSTGAAGSFASSITGVAPTEVWTYQADWNGLDTFDGTGLTGITLDPTKGNVFQIDFQYLGFGGVAFYMEDPDDRELHNFHTIPYANLYNTPSLRNPTLPLYASVTNTTNATDIVMYTASMASFIDGQPKNLGVFRGYSNQKTLTGTASETPILSLRVNEVFASTINRSKIKLNLISAAVEHTKPVQFKIYINPELVSANWQSIDSNTSSIQYDTSATAVSIANKGYFVHAIPLGKSANGALSFLGDDVIGELGPGDSLVITALPNSANGAECTVSINFTEKI